MRLWRISNYPDLKGIGGTKKKGRWHNPGAPIVYLSENPALAMLEVMVHFELDQHEFPENYQLLEIEYTHRKGVSHLSSGLLGDGWQHEQDMTRAYGDEWLVGGSTLLLRVPSAILPHSYNYLFNPKHVLAGEAKIVAVSKHPFDKRLT